MHLVIFSCGVFSPSRSSRRHTYPAATNAKHAKMARATMFSFKSPVTLSPEKSMTCKSSPCDEYKSVRNPYHKHPPSGLAGISKSVGIESP